MFWSITKRGVLCAVLGGLGLVAMRGMAYLRGSTEPRVDFSQRVRIVDAAVPRSTDTGNRLRFAVATMVSAEATFATYHRLVKRVARDVGSKGAFVVRPSYAAVRRALETGEVDVAFVCTGTYVHSLDGGRVKLLVQPEFADGMEYRCLVLVPSQSTDTTLQDLRGRVMAFTDPESNTGCLVPSAALANRGYKPESFFKKVVFTGSHDRSILAVALGVVDAAAVDALVWQSNVRQDPSLAHRAKEIWRSETFGPPPIVVPAELPEDLARSLRKTFLALHKDAEGRKILSDIGIKQFVPPRPECYRSSVKMYRQLQRQGGAP